MAAAAAQLPGAQQPQSSPNKRRRGGPTRQAAWHPWQHNAQLVARGGRMAKELHQEAVDCCKVWGRGWTRDQGAVLTRAAQRATGGAGTA